LLSIVKGTLSRSLPIRLIAAERRALLGRIAKQRNARRSERPATVIVKQPNTHESINAMAISLGALPD
jgi:hypothetical protein